MAVCDTYVFPRFLTPVLTQLFFPKPPTTFLTCFCRGERRKYVGKKSRLNRGLNSQPPGHQSDMLTTEPPWQGSEFSLANQIHKVLEKENGFSPLPDDTILDWSKFQQIADNISKCICPARGVQW